MADADAGSLEEDQQNLFGQSRDAIFNSKDEVFTGYMDDDKAEKFMNKETGAVQPKKKSNESKYLIQGKSQGGQIYDLDQSELIKLSFEKNLNPKSGEDQT